MSEDIVMMIVIAATALVALWLKRTFRSHDSRHYGDGKSDREN